MKSWQALTLAGIAIILCALALGCGGSYTPPPTLVISAITLPAGLVGNTYNASFAATGGITPYTWTLYSGSLPVGMNLGSSGSLAGIPTTAGQFTFTVQVADAETPQATATQQVMLTINPAPPALYVSQTSLPEGVVNTAYSTTIQVAGGLPPYSFSLTQGSLPPGLTLSGTGVVSGTPTQAGASSFTVQVSDAESPPQTTSSPIYITIVATPLTISTTTLPDAVVNVPYFQQLQVTGGSPPYTWLEQNLGQGFFLTSGGLVTTSPFGFVEWPKQVGTASFTVKVMDSAQQVASQSLSVTIDLGGNVLLNGSYLFMASGFGPGGTSQWAVAGSLVADGNGNITSGELDMNSTASAPQDSAITGTYSISPNGLGTMTLNSATSSVTFAFALSSSFNLQVGNTIATGQIIEFDDASGQGSRAAGVITPQGTSFLAVRYLSGFYVFGYSGQDVATSGRLAEVGLFGFDPSGAFYKGGGADSNDAGTVNSLTLDGSLAEFDNAGRSLATITVTGGGPPRVEHYALYAGRKLDNSAQMYAVSIDALNGSGQLLSGPVLSQGPSGDLDNTFLQGTLVLQAAGLNVSGGQSSGVAAAGLATFDGAGNITKLDVEQNAGGTFNFYNGIGTYSVSSNGRTTLAAQGLPSIAYLAGANEMFAISTDASATLAYFQQQQSGAPFSNASLSGYYSAGSLPPVEANVTNSVLQLTADGNGNLTGVGDNSGPNGLQSNVNFAGTYSLDATGKSPLSGSLSGYMYLGGYGIDFGLPEFIVVTGESNPRVLTILGY